MVKAIQEERPNSQAGPEHEVTGWREVFKVKTVPLYSTPAIGRYQNNLRPKKHRNTSLVGPVLASWHAHLLCAEMLSKVRDRATRLISISHLGWMNEVTSVSHLCQVKIMYMEQPSESRYKKIPQLEQKRSNLLQGAIYKLTSPENLILDRCRKTITNGRTCLLLFQNYRFMWCGKNSNWVTEVTSGPAETYAT